MELSSQHSAARPTGGINMMANEKAKAIKLVVDQAERTKLEFFHDTQRHAYATVPVAEHNETWPIHSRDFKLWVRQSMFNALGTAPKTFVAACIEEFETRAICQGPTKDVFVRVGEHEGANYIDLVNDHWQVVQVTSEQWCILNQPPVKFRRPMGTTELPHPALGGNLTDFSGFLNVSRESEVLLLTWLSFALHPHGPYPILALLGPQGTGKSTISKVLRALIDPSDAALTALPRSARDLAIAATNAHLITMDNLSVITPEFSDMLCRVATGGAFRTRKLYTDDEESLFTFQRPQIINGIEELPERADLLDRTLLVRPDPIPEEKRRDEKSFWQDFEDARPRLFGCLLDVFSAGLRHARGVALPTLPRMADFAKWGVAVERALGFAPGEFLAAYQKNIQHASDAALEASPVAYTAHLFLRRQGAWSGPALKLLKVLNDFAVEIENGRAVPNIARKNPRWPKSAQQLSAEIARIEPNLAKLGIQVERGRTNSGRFISLRLVTHVPDDGDAAENTASCDYVPKAKGVGAT
jgi:hypothetical protein